MTPGRLPTFYVVGAMKSGTSSLHRAIAAHPDVFMSTPKELHYFVEDRNWQRGVQWYAEQFAPADGALAIGEASVTYTQMPYRPGVPERMAALTPEARIIYLVRHPVERMLSHYRHNLACGRESREPDAAFERRGNYLAFSRYGTQLRYYQDRFPPEQLLVLPAERFFTDPVRVVRRIWTFLGLPPSDVDVPSVLINATKDRPAPVAAARRLRHSKGVAGAWNVLPKTVRARVKKAVPRSAMGTQQLTLSVAERQRIQDLLRPEVAMIAPYVDGPFDRWELV
ncbi:MAG: sulfotransferase family protein [Actinomycetes bacterium]